MIITPKEFYEKLKPCSEKRIETECDNCKKITSTTYANYKRSQDSKGNTGETLCRKCSSIKSGIAKRGKVSPKKGIKLPHLAKENSKKWNGGTYISSDGYRMIFIDNDNINSGWDKYRKEHILVMEKYIGRKIAKGECVHHIDGDKLNNDISNLIILTGKEHKNSHQSLQELGYRLIKEGIISYDKENKKYYFTKDKNAKT